MKKSILIKKYIEILTKLLFAASILCFLSCEQNPGAEVTDYEISEIYGYTFYGNITASSGNSLIPSLIIYNENRCDWNMNTNGMTNNQFYYYSVKNSAANYTLYWFTADNLCYCAQKDFSKASMTVQIGINSPSQIVILLTGDGLTSVSGMTNTRLPMVKQNIPQNTSPGNIIYDSNVQDINIEIPSFAENAVWQGDSSYSGSYSFLVLGGNESYLAKGQGENVKVSVTDTNSSFPNTVTIKTHDVFYTEQMSVCSFEISQVQVKKYGEVYYLLKDSGTVTFEKEDGSGITLNEVSIKGKLENGILTWRVSFKPGKMPFPIVEIFTSEN